MQYVTRDGKIFKGEFRSYRVRPSIMVCALATLILLLLRLLLHSNPGLIVDTLTLFRDIGVAIWVMVCDAAETLAAFLRFITPAR